MSTTPTTRSRFNPNTLLIIVSSMAIGFMIMAILSIGHVGESTPAPVHIPQPAAEHINIGGSTDINTKCLSNAMERYSEQRKANNPQASSNYDLAYSYCITTNGR